MSKPKRSRPALPSPAGPPDSALAAAMAAEPDWSYQQEAGAGKLYIAEQIATVYHAGPQAKIDIIKQGRPATDVDALAELMSIPKETLINTLRLSRATVNRKARALKTLSSDETERLLGVEMLIGQVATMVGESGDPASFDAAGWTAKWLAAPLPALGRRTPASFMDTIEGQRLVSRLLATTQSGAYT